METVYLICAVVGGTLIVCQFLLGLLGLGDHHDAGGGDGGMHDLGPHDASGHDGDAGHDTAHDASHETAQHSAATWFFSMLTFRTLVAAVTFFGLAGLSAGETMPPLPTLGIALGAGSAALLVVGYLMRALKSLNVDGTARIERAVGTTGTVYLSIPGRATGAGKVHIRLQNRIVECKAVTAGDDLPTGAKVVVVSVADAHTLQVAPIANPERTTHV